MPNSSGFKPFLYQEDTIQGMQDFNGRSLLALDPGLGKTYIALESLKRRSDWLPALVVCPASVKYQWQSVAQVQFGMQASVCEGRTPPKEGFTPGTPITIINYDILKDWQKHLMRNPFRSMFIDESQYVMNLKAQRSKATVKIGHKIPNRFALSGTPLTQRTKELYATLHFLWPEHYKSAWSFYQNYTQARKTKWGWDFTRSRNTDQLHKELLERGMIRYRKADVLKDLPEKIRSIIPCPLSRPSEYQEAQDNFLVYLMKHKAHKIQRAIRAQRLFQMGELLRLTAKLKIVSVVSWINDWLVESDEKLVVLGTHHAAINTLKKRIKAKSVVITGKVTGKKREQAKEQFRRDDKTRVLIGNIQAMGVGIDGLQDVCNTMCIVETVWRPADLDQAEARLERIGQHNPVWIYYLIAANTIEEKICQKLQEKRQVVSSVLDGGSTPEDFQIFDAICSEFEKGFIQ